MGGLTLAALLVTSGGGFYLNDKVGDLVRDEVAALDTISIDVKAGAAMATLATRLPYLVRDQRAVEEIVIQLAASREVREMALVEQTLLPLIEQLGPAEQWSTVDKLEEQLGEYLDDPETCSAMATAFGVRVIGAPSQTTTTKPIRAVWNKYLDCLAGGVRPGELHFWRLLEARIDGKSDDFNAFRLQTSKFEEDEYAEFRDMHTMLILPKWAGDYGKRVREVLDDIDEKHADLFADPGLRDVMAFSPPPQNRLELGVTVSGSLVEGDSEVGGHLTDGWVFSVGEGELVVVDATAEFFDMYIIVVGPTAAIGRNDDFQSLDSRCSVEGVGDYVVLVHDYWDEAQFSLQESEDGGVPDYGAYQLTIRPLDESQDYLVESCH